jgi:alpha-N-arabinofuranosidase
MGFLYGRTSMTTGIRATVAALAAGAVALTASGPAWAGDEATTVTVRPGVTLAALHSGAVGADEPIWSPAFTDPAVPGLIRKANLQTLEFNGGGVSDLYHWKTGTAQADPDPTGHPDYASLPPQFTFDQFEKTAHATGTKTLVHVNYGTGTPAEAAAWVRYAKHQHDHVSGWAIGEEVWGNGGLSGINFEPDGHADKSPQAYAANSLKFIAAMKAADPSARVGVELFGVQGDPFQAWDETVMSIVGQKADFVDIHAYPFGLDDTSDAGVLAFPRTIAPKMAAVRQLVNRYASPRTQIVVGETNSAAQPTAQQIGPVNALYLADDVLSLLYGGAVNVDWWALHNGGFGVFGGGDLGLLSTGDCNDDNTLCAPPAQTPFRPYRAMQLVGAMTRRGGAMVPVTSSTPLVVGHAVRGPGGTLAVLVQNDDPAKAAAVRFAVPGYHAVSAVRYGRTDQAPHPVAVGTALPAYSLTLIQFRR